MRRMKPSPWTQRSSPQGDPERGAASVLVAFLLVALLGFAALAVDVGALYWEKTQLQSGADAAALAIATDCAAGACGPVAATGQFFADSNANDSSSGATVTRPTANSVRVETNARDAGSGEDRFSLFFARALGFESTPVTAVAEAAWGPPARESTFPWTVSDCVFRQFLSPSQRAELEATQNFTGDPLSTPVLLRFDTGTIYPGCGDHNLYRPGGFGWLEPTGTGCSAVVNTGGNVDGRPGNNYPNTSDCRDMLATLMGEPALIPLFDSTSGNGRNTVYHLIGFAAFELTAFKLEGGVESNPLPANCERDCRAIEGRFTRFVALDGLPAAPGSPNYGASIVNLTR